MFVSLLISLTYQIVSIVSNWVATDSLNKLAHGAR